LPCFRKNFEKPQATCFRAQADNL